ncbi:MAG: VWA domain-containing protein [Candidatus Sumerlaeia bacterium]|nr:VWA domain-containing protein [Candidatus Sumerlaeia bacterium]
MVLGGGEADGTGHSLAGADAAMEAALAALYDQPGTGASSGKRSAGAASGKRSAGLGGSAPNVARWLGDIRNYFRTDVVRVIQKDALERLGLQRMLLEPEFLESVEADVGLVATIMSLSSVIPARTRETARRVVRKVVEELMRRLETPMRAAVSGALNRSARINRPRHSEIDWNRTIRVNLKHWQAEHGTIIPERLVGYGRRQRRKMRDIILCVDQSGSMAESIVYSSIFGAVMASLPAVSTRLVVFDTAVVDLTDELEDPVDVLFGVQLGGGTDINGAMAYCQSRIRAPQETILVLISDLFEGGVEEQLVARVANLLASGVQVVVLLALSDSGHPSYDAELAAKLAALGAPSFACTPDKFPDLMAAAIGRRDLAQWASENGLVATRPGAE